MMIGTLRFLDCHQGMALRTDLKTRTGFDFKSVAGAFMYSPATALAMGLFQLLMLCSVMWWLGLICPLLRPRRAFSDRLIKSPRFVSRRAFAVDVYVLAYLVAEVAISIWVCAVSGTPGRLQYYLVTALAASRIVEIVQIAVNTSIFDPMSGAVGHRVARTERMLVLAILNFLELCLCFGLIYALNVDLLFNGTTQVSEHLAAFYFSAITQLTIGYGDVYPTQWLRFLAPMQGFLAFAYGALIFSRFVASMEQMKGVLKDSRDG